jgi:hypothetical protein
MHAKKIAGNQDLLAVLMGASTLVFGLGFDSAMLMKLSCDGRLVITSCLRCNL